MRLTLTHRLRPDRERVFAEPDVTHVQAEFDEVSRMLERSHPKIATIPAATCSRSAGSHQTLAADLVHKPVIKVVNKEINRRTDVSACSPLPNAAELLRLAGAVLVEQHEEWEATSPPPPLRGLHAPTGRPA